ncbi:phospholipase [Bacteroidales bacterium OttesenSCG-928-L03]|nr:phospholipase [Bacteroidales bacterium OttesenSCG-928-L03]
MKLKNLFQSDNKTTYPLEKEEEICCGQHEICEKDLMKRALAEPITYYEDEELDAFRGRPSDSYTGEETGVFAEVLRTMWQSDVSGWFRSLQLRGIELPDALKDEAILLING